MIIIIVIIIVIIVIIIIAIIVIILKVTPAHNSSKRAAWDMYAMVKCATGCNPLVFKVFFRNNQIDCYITGCDLLILMRYSIISSTTLSS